jgi:hypothetical protein
MMPIAEILGVVKRDALVGRSERSLDRTVVSGMRKLRTEPLALDRVEI